MECMSFSYLIKIGGKIPDKVFSSWDINLAAKGRLWRQLSVCQNLKNSQLLVKNKHLKKPVRFIMLLQCYGWNLTWKGNVEKFLSPPYEWWPHNRSCLGWCGRSSCRRTGQSFPRWAWRSEGGTLRRTCTSHSPAWKGSLQYIHTSHLGLWQPLLREAALCNRWEDEHVSLCHCLRHKAWHLSWRDTDVSTWDSITNLNLYLAKFANLTMVGARHINTRTGQFYRPVPDKGDILPFWWNSFGYLWFLNRVNWLLSSAM